MAADVPQFFGPARDGVVRGARPLADGGVAAATVDDLTTSVTLTLEADKTYLCHLLEGQLTVQGQQVAPGETLVVQGEESIRFECGKKTTLAFFTLQAR